MPRLRCGAIPSSSAIESAPEPPSTDHEASDTRCMSTPTTCSSTRRSGRNSSASPTRLPRSSARAASRTASVLVSAMHITSGVYVNDWEDGLIHDFQTWLEKLAPAGPQLSASSDRRGQRRRAPQTDDHGPSGRLAHYRRQAGSRSLGAGLLRRIRRPAQEAGRGQGDGNLGQQRECLRQRSCAPDRRRRARSILDGARVLLVRRGARSRSKANGVFPAALSSSAKRSRPRSPAK